MPGRGYYEVVTINGVSLYAGNGDPNGAFSAARGSVLSDKDPGGFLWRNVDGASAWEAVLEYDPTGEVKGSVLYHDGTSWVVLPPGVAGRFLRTNGAGADPTWSPAGGGGTSPFVATNEWFVDNTAAADPTMRIFPTIATALADLDAVLPAGEEGLVRLRDGQLHSWDGTSLPTGRDTVIYCPVRVAEDGPVYCEVALADPFTAIADVSLTFQNVLVSNPGEFGSYTFGLFYLVFNDCRGSLPITVVDAPTAAASKTILFDGCEGFATRIVAADAVGGGAVFVQRSSISSTLTGTLLDNSAALTTWGFVCRNRSKVSLSANGGVALAIDTFDAQITDSDFSVDMSNGGTFTLTNWTVLWGGCTLRVFYYDSDIDTFLFGDPGYASPFQFCEFGPLTCWFTDPSGEVDADYPLDAPITTQAVGSRWLGIMTLDYGSYTPQWRGAYDTVRMGQRTTALAPAGSLESVNDKTIYIASLFVGNSTHYLISGTITVTRSGVPGTAAAWSVSALIQQTAAGVFTVLAGGLTVISNVPGYPTPTLTGVATSGIRIDVSQGLVGGNNDWTAMLNLNEQTIGI